MMMCMVITLKELKVAGVAGENGDNSPHLQLEFKCFLVDQKTGKHIPVGCKWTF